MKDYFTLPPNPKKLDVPAFMYGRYNTDIYDTKYVLRLFQWAELEYLDTVAWLTNTFQYKKLDMLRKYNWTVILASTKEFKELTKNMTDSTWRKYPKPVRDIIADVHSIMLSLQ